MLSQDINDRKLRKKTKKQQNHEKEFDFNLRIKMIETQGEFEIPKTRKIIQNAGYSNSNSTSNDTSTGYSNDNSTSMNTRTSNDTSTGYSTSMSTRRSNDTSNDTSYSTGTSNSTSNSMSTSTSTSTGYSTNNGNGTIQADRLLKYKLYHKKQEIIEKRAKNLDRERFLYSFYSNPINYLDLSLLINKKLTISRLFNCITKYDPFEIIRENQIRSTFLPIKRIGNYLIINGKIPRIRFKFNRFYSVNIKELEPLDLDDSLEMNKIIKQS
jgi:hypothetical protein